LGSVEIFPGGSRELEFHAFYRSGGEKQFLTKEHAQQIAGTLKPTERAFWQFHFSDGSVYRVGLKSVRFSSGRAVHDADLDNCESLYP
jgi:hypothetical protein